MGYCFPVWASTYDYQALLAARTPTTVAVQAEVARDRQPVLVVRGEVADGRITLLPIFQLTARPSTASVGAYRVQGRNARGSVLFSQSFAPTPVDHARVELFTVAVPMTSAAARELAEVRVTSPGGIEARMLAAPGAAASTTSPTGALRSSRGVTVACADKRSTGLLVVDPSTGAVLASGAGSRLVLPAGFANELRVHCSDGLHTSTQVVRY